MKKNFLFILILLLLTLRNIFTEENKNIKPDKKLIAAAWKTASRINQNPIKLEVVFDKKFIQQIGEEKLIKTLRDIYNQTGSIIKVSTINFSSEYYGEFFFHSQKDYILPVTLGINKIGKVNTLSFRPAFKKIISTPEIIEKFKLLNYEKKGIIIKKLTQIEDTLYSLNENEIFAIASASQLYILAWLGENEKKWDRIIKIKKENSIPPGTISNYPDGAPATIFTLAYHMISENDNTAADLLIDYITKQKIEKYISQHNSNYVLNIPFLKTLEAIKLKKLPSVAEKYFNLSYSQKINIINSLKDTEIDFSKTNLNEPLFINSIEWFATPTDICKILDHIRILNNPFVNSILESNRKFDTKSAGYIWTGFKDGYEAGVLTLNWLVQAKDNRYYCISMIINDSKKNINKEEVFTIAQELLNVFGSE